jgi:hypothetical protein
LNKEAIAINQDPLGLAGDLRGNFADGGQVWSRILSSMVSYVSILIR